jgi:ectoine hydroxylase-related dioxygenase (phytanoyl-CoA dioxygenase family)
MSEPAPLDDAEAALFRRRGWHVTAAILDDALLDAAQAGIARYLAGGRDRVLPDIASVSDWRPEHGHAMRQIGYLSLQIAEVAALVSHPAIAGTAARLTGASGIRLFHDRLIAKPPGVEGGGTVQGWHTDRAYWMTCTSDELLTAWIPFQDCTVEMGPLAVVEGSHLWDGTEWMATAHETDLDALEQRFPVRPGGWRAVELTLRRGQVSFHHCRAIHGSRANRSPFWRTALAVHLQPADNRYRPHRGPDGRPLGHLNAVLCRTGPDGEPDYADPEVFPTLWPPPPHPFSFLPPGGGGRGG